MGLVMGATVDPFGSPIPGKPTPTATPKPKK